MMDRDLPVVPSMVFVAALVLSVMIYIAQTPYTSPAIVSQVIVDSEDTLWAVYKNRLIEIDERRESERLRVLSLQDHGVEFHAGNLLALRQGGWLINRGGQHNDFLSDIKVFLRLTAPEVKAGSSSLMKCDSHLYNCAEWGDKKLQFDRAWSAIETANGQFIINDVSRHEIYLISKSGELLNTMTGFRFPNQTVSSGGSHWVTDTNRSKIVEIEIRDGRLLKTGNLLDLKSLKGVDDEHRLPGRIAYRDNAWWLMVHDGNMANAGIYRVADGEHVADRFGGDVKDPVDMVWHGNRLYLTDYITNAIWYMDLSAGKSSRLKIPVLENLIEEERQRATVAWNKTWLLIALTMLTGSVAFVLALKKSKPVPLGKNKLKENQIDFSTLVSLEHPPSGKIIWIPKNKKIMRLMYWAPITLVVAFAAIVFIVLFVFLQVPEAVDEIMAKPKYLFILAGITVMFAAMLALLAPRVLKLNRSKLGFLNAKLVYSPHPGKGVPIQAGDILYNDTGFYTRGTGYIHVQNHSYVFYDKKAFTKYALPVVQQGRKVRIIRLYRQRLKDADKDVWIELGLVVLIFGLFLMFELVLH